MSRNHIIRRLPAQVAETAEDYVADQTSTSSLADNLTPNGVPGVDDTYSAAFNGAQSKHDGRDFEPLAKDYIARVVESMLRMPSARLRQSSPQYYADLKVRRELIGEAMKGAGNNPSKAFVNALMATQVGGGSLDAVRLVRDAARQLLWIFAVDVQRDRRTAGDDNREVTDFERAFGSYPGNDEEPEHPTEADARVAYAEAHAWLSSLADLIPVDEEERMFLALDKGLEYASLPTGATGLDGKPEYENCYDFEQALEAQIAKNEESFKRRAERHVQATKEKFAALAALAG